MAENSRMSKLSSKDDECVFSWKMFTGWDFMIGHAETAHNRVASVVLGFKEALLEEAEKKKDKRNWRVIALRILVNLKVLALLAVSAYAVILVVNRSTEPEANDSWWRSNEITVVMSAISFFFPMIFETLGLLEYYHPRQQLRLQLGRIMLLNLLNLYSLIFALFDKISGMTKELIQIRQNLTGELLAPTFDPLITTSNLYNPLDFSNVLPTDDPKYLETIVKTVATLSAAMLFNRTIAQASNITVCTNITYQCPISSPNIDVVTWHVLNVTTTLWTTHNPFDSMNETTTFGDYDFLTDNSTFIGNESTSTSYYDYDNGTTPFYYDSSTIGEENSTDIGDKRFNTKNEDDLDYQEYYEVYVSSKEKRDEIEEVTQGEPQDEDYGQESYDDEQIYKREIPVDFFDEISEMFSKLNENIELTSPLPENISEIIESTVTTLFDDFSTENSTDYNFTQSILDMVENLTLYITELTTDVPTTTEFEIEVEEEICYREVCELVEQTTPEDYPDYDLTSTKPTEFFEEIYSATSDKVVPVKEITEQTTNPTTTFSSLTQATITPCRIIPENISHADAATKLKLRRLCWETMFGQELVKLTVMDLLITISSTMMFDFFRALFVRFMNKCWCWDLEKRYPKYGDFKVAENILHLVNNQGMVWMGMFFSPGLAILNLVKLVIIMYLRSWTVLSCNVPHEVVFRASRSNNFYLALLLTMLFLCVLPVGYAIVWLEPSWHCGPFSHHDRIYKIFTKTLENTLPTYLNKRLDYVASPSTVIPLLVLLILIIYYLISLTGALREANEDLKIQLKRERTEERKKMLKIAQPGADQTNAPIAISDRWKKVLASTSPLTPSGAAVPEPDEMKIQARKELIARIMKKALRKSSLATSDDDSAAALAPDDGTDTEQHDSLPHDRESHTNLEKKAKKDRRASTRPPDDKEKANVPQFLKKGKAGDSWLSLIKTAAAEKSPKLEDVKKPEETVPHRHRHRNKPEEVQRKDSNDEEQENNARVVSERRKSILRRQNKLPEKTDFEVVNEKPKKQSPMESKLYNEITQPEVFLFDQEFIHDRNDLNYMSDDNSSYMEILPKMKSKAPIITKSSEDLTSNKKQKKRRSPPEERKNGYDSDESAGNENDKSKRKDKVYPKKDAKIIEMFKKKDDEEIITKEPVKKIKKLNSFLALVREAVQNKKQEENKSIEDEHLEDIKLLPSTSKEFNEIVPKDKKSPTDRVNKRQDSNSSNWSENIPVITISKTESDECILEEGGKPIDKHKRRRRSEKKKEVEESVQ